MKLRKILSLTLAVLMLAACMSFTTSADTMLIMSAPAKTVYVSDEGTEDGDGLSPQTPFNTYQKAIEAVKDGGTVVLVGDTTFKDSITTPITGEVVVTAMLDGESTGAVLIHDGYNNYAAGSTGLIKFENIQMTQTTNWAPTYFYNLNVEIGDGVTGPNAPGVNSPSFILGGDGSGNGSIGGKMVVRSGKNFRTIILACGRHPKEVNDINLEYYGGNVKFSYGFAQPATLENRPNKVGNVNLLIEAQPMNTEGFIQSSHITEITGAIQIIMNNNVGVEYSLVDEVPAKNGKFVIMSEEGGRVDFTETAGTFKVSSKEYTTAVIENDDGLVGEYELEVDGDECYAEIALKEGTYYVSYEGDAPVFGAPYEVVMENVTAYKNQHNISYNGKAIANKNDGYTLANGTEVPFSINFEGTNYLPARKLSEILSITIGYEADSRTVLVDTKTENTTDPLDGIVKESKNSGEAKISVAKNSVKIKVDGKKVVSQDENFKTQSGTEVPCSLIYEGTTYLPVRKLSELLGVGIDYDSETQTVLIEKKVEEEIVVTPGAAVALSNTYYKLTQEKKLSVAYIGGSVTAGYGATYAPDDCWPAQIGRWLNEKFPDAEIKNQNMPIGGTGSYSATFRYDYEIAPLEPDLLFVEYVINDWGAANCDGSKLSYDQVTRTAESIVRQAYEVNPNIDIIFVLTFNSSTRDSDFTELVAHRNVAQHYNLPYIKMGEKFYKMLAETGKTFSSLYKDHVHPNTEGYKFFGEQIIGLVETELKKAEEAAVDSIVAHKLPETTVSKEPLMMNATLVPADKIDLTGATGWKYQPNTAFVGCGLRYNGRLYGVGKGSKFTFTFTGTDFGMFVGGDYVAGIVRCTLEDGTTVDVDAYQYHNPLQRTVFENLEYGEHTVEIEIIGKNSNATGSSYIYEIGALFYN